jgi:hypothetical protein
LSSLVLIKKPAGSVLTDINTGHSLISNYGVYLFYRLRSASNSASKNNIPNYEQGENLFVNIGKFLSCVHPI